MRNILVLGAGRSSSSLIKYLLDNAKLQSWQVYVGDASVSAAEEKIQGHPNGTAFFFDVNDDSTSMAIASADVVISLLPAVFHPLVAVHCLKHGKHLITASYVSDEMKGLHEEALAKNLLFLNECGLDPGIDHMSAMKVIDHIRSLGGELESFESFTGGLIAQDTDPENPWRYKFTWNPRNVVLAGQGTAKYLENGKFKYIPYQQLFKRITPVVIPGLGAFEGYANRDSLKYIETYGLQGIKTMLRGTLRSKGFSAAWNVLVQLGCCDDSYQLDDVSNMTHRSFIELFLENISGKNTMEILSHQFNLPIGSEALTCLRWSGFFDDEPIGLLQGTPAQILEHILNKKWKLSAHDKDQIVMWHRFVYRINSRKKEIQSSLVATGQDSMYTAMSKTVGLPLGIAAKLLLDGKIKSRGVVIPVNSEVYEPVLLALSKQNIELRDVERELL